MMFWHMQAMTAAALLPLGAMLCRALPGTGKTFAPHARHRMLAAVALLWLLGTFFLCLRPHQDTFTGLDNSAYRQLAHAFASGRGPHETDELLLTVPPPLRGAFFYRDAPGSRRTRDLIFEVLSRDTGATAPFFLPTLPLAAAGLDPLLRPEGLMSIMGSLWLGLVLLASLRAGRSTGLWVAAAMLLGTAWPAWFLRGFYPEGMGAILVSAVMLSIAVRPVFKVWDAAAAGIALGFSVSCHPTLAVLAAPPALWLFCVARPRACLALSGGGLIGLAPLFYFTKHVCQPYGNWMDPDTLRSIVAVSAEHRALALVLILAVAGLLAALLLRFSPRGRRRLSERIAGLSPGWWMGAAILLLTLPMLLPGDHGRFLRRGALGAWTGLRIPFTLLLLAGVAGLVRRDRPLREKFWLLSLAAGTVFFLYIKGLERSAGVWSFRRLLPVILLTISLLAAPMSAVLVSLPSARRTQAGILILALGLCNFLRWPSLYGRINEADAHPWTREVIANLDADLVLFDYLPHSVPYAQVLPRKVLGLGEHSQGRWPDVATWLAVRSRTQDILLVTAWEPCTLESGVRLEPAGQSAIALPTYTGRTFFPPAPIDRNVRHTFMRMRPVEKAQVARQDKLMDESPIGLRGPWEPCRRRTDGGPRRWSRQGSGIVGPVPAPGESIRFIIDCAFTGTPPGRNAQQLRIDPPWNAPPAELTVNAEWRPREIVLKRPADSNIPAVTGTYRLTVRHPYDPGRHGLRGYPRDLGVEVRRIVIENSSPGGKAHVAQGSHVPPIPALGLGQTPRKGDEARHGR